MEQKTVLLFSSGMDSYILNRLLKPDILLFIDNKSKYSSVERELITKRFKYRNLVVVEDFINMSTIEREDFIIPSRNLYFCTIAAQYGDIIYMGATAGDRSTDKDLLFAKQMTEVLSHIYEKSHWCEGLVKRVEFPYKNYTKQDLIKEYIVKTSQELSSTKEEATKVVVEELLNLTFSCYHPTKDGEQCNRCKPDLRKYLAILGATGIDTSYYYKISPREYFTPEVIREWIKKESSESNRGRESLEIIETLKNLL